MTDENGQRNLAQRIVAIQKAVAGIQTDPSAYGKGYKIDRAIRELREHAVEHGVFWYVSKIESDTHTEKLTVIGDGGKPKEILETIVNVTLEVTFVNTESPDDKLVTFGIGQGLDRGDKAPGKAHSYALKTVLLTVFNLRGHEESEDDASPRQGGASQSRGSNHKCPACGSGVHHNPGNVGQKKPVWRCSNNQCTGGGAKKEGDGNWPWASFDADFPKPKPQQQKPPVNEDYQTLKRWLIESPVDHTDKDAINASFQHITGKEDLTGKEVFGDDPSIALDILGRIQAARNDNIPEESIWIP